MCVTASFMAIDGWCEMPGNILFSPILYNDNAYIGLKDYHALKTFLAINDNNQVLARVRFAKMHTGSNWVSLPGAPFGGIEIASEFEISDFIDYVKSYLKIGEKLEIKTPPDIYHHPDRGMVDAGFDISAEEINHHVDLTSSISVHGMEERRLGKALNAGCTFKRWDLDPTNAMILHEFISKCREAQGLQINIDKDDFLKTIDAIPSAYHAYAVELKDQIIAATVVVKVTSDIAYNYLPASDKAFNHLSPMVLLMTQLYEELGSQGFVSLDWGVTSIDGKEQTSLAKFKEAMGAVRSKKRILTYELS